MYVRKYYDTKYEQFIVEIRDDHDLKERKVFKDFYSFDRFLNHDLNGADLYDYDGFDNIDLSKFNLAGAYVKDKYCVNEECCDILLKDELNLGLCNSVVEAKKEVFSSEKTFYDIANVSSVKDYFRYSFYYVSDIHLDHKLFNDNETSLSLNEIRERIKRIINEFYNTMDRKTCMMSIVLIAGDVSHNFDVNIIFYQEFVKKFSNSKIVAVLGNHELWCFKDTELPSDILVEYTINRFKELFGTLGIIFLNNELLLFSSREKHVLSMDSIINIKDETEDLLKKARLAILGGTGFSGRNEIYNAMFGLYRRAISDNDTDKLQSERFRQLHNSFSRRASDVRTIVLTHNPLPDWTDDGDYVAGWIYVNGHTHNNFSCNISGSTIYADNQLGYSSEIYTFKEFFLDSDVDTMRKYNDGIYEISDEEYKTFYLLKNKWIEFKNIKQRKIIMLKKKGIYCFLAQDDKNLYLLSGGKICKLKNQNINYYFDNLDKYAKIATSFFKGYDDALNKISGEIIGFGGNGRIHGCIVDIDYYNHVYVNPFDMKITPYFAYNIREKYVYNDVGSLLADRRKDLLETFHAQLPAMCGKKGVSVFALNSEDCYSKGKLVLSTEIYEISALFKKFQYLKSNNIIRVWKDELICENNGDQQIGILLKEVFISKPEN